MFFDLFTTSVLVIGLLSWNHDYNTQRNKEENERLSDEYRALLKAFEYQRYMDAYKRENPELEDELPEDNTDRERTANDRNDDRV